MSEDSNQPKDQQSTPTPTTVQQLKPLPAEKLRNPKEGDGALGNERTGHMYYKGKDKKELVITVQKMLKTLVYDLGTSGKDGVDGKFEDKTEEAVRDFQGKNKNWDGEQLKVDGLVGPKTSDALNRAMVGKQYENSEWYDHYQTPVKLTSASVLLTATSEALKSPVSIEIEDEKKGKVVITTPLPKPKPHKNVIECETWDGWKASNARYVIILKSGEVKGLAGEEADAYITDDEGRIKPEHIPSEAFKLYVFPPRKIDDLTKLKVKRDDYKYIYTRSGTKIEPKSDTKILVPYGEAVDIPAADDVAKRYRIICNLNLLILAPSLGYPGILQEDYVDVVALTTKEITKMWYGASENDNAITKNFLLECLRYQPWEGLQNWNNNSMRWDGDLKGFEAIDDMGTGTVTESDLIAHLSPRITKAYAPWNLDSMFQVRFKFTEKGSKNCNLVNLQGEDVALHLILSDREFFKEMVDYGYQFTPGQNDCLKGLPLVVVPEWDKNAGYETPYEKIKVRLIHPFFQFESSKSRLNIAHLTDVHVSTRWELFQLKLGNSSFNNYNKAFSDILKQVNGDSEADIVVVTGDLIDYNRGHDGSPDSDNFKQNYWFNRNWLLFWEIFIQKYKKPMFTVLGNHEYLVNPYPEVIEAVVTLGLPLISIFHIPLMSKFTGFESDMNITKEQGKTILCPEGSEERKIIHLDNNEASDLMDARDNMDEAFIQELLFKKAKDEFNSEFGIYFTHSDSVTWYHLLINPFTDHSFTYKDMSILMLDWNEKTVPGSVLILPRPQNCSSENQLRLMKDWVRKSTAAQIRILCTHAPIVHATPKAGDRWLQNCMLKDNHNQILKRENDYKYKDQVEKALSPRRKLMAATVPERKMMYGIVSDENREKLLNYLHPENENYPIQLVLSGHTHTNRIFTADTVNRDLIHLKRDVDEFHLGTQYPPLFVVTISGGPLGWLDEVSKWLELMPHGYRIINIEGGLKFISKYRKPNINIPEEIRDEANEDSTFGGLKDVKVLIRNDAPSEKIPQNNSFGDSVLITKLSSDFVINDVEDGRNVVIKEVGKDKKLTLKNDDDVLCNYGTVVVLDNYGTIEITGNKNVFSVDKNWSSGLVDIKSNMDDIFVRTNNGIIKVKNGITFPGTLTTRPEVEVLENAGVIFIEENTGGMINRSVVYVERNLKGSIVNINGNDDQISINENFGEVDINKNDDRIDVMVNNGTVKINKNDDEIHIRDNKNGTINVNANDGKLYLPKKISPNHGIISPTPPPGDVIEE